MFAREEKKKETLDFLKSHTWLFKVISITYIEFNKFVPLWSQEKQDTVARTIQGKGTEIVKNIYNYREVTWSNKLSSGLWKTK